MADRKQFLSSSTLRPDLAEALRAAKETRVTEDMLHAQRVSFAFGNAMASDTITKESVAAASQSIRLHA